MAKITFTCSLHLQTYSNFPELRNLRTHLTNPPRRRLSPSNIAEGFSRLSPNEKIRFYNIAESSLEEIRYQLILAKDLNFAETEELQAQAIETKRLIIGLIKSIKSRN